MAGQVAATITSPSHGRRLLPGYPRLGQTANLKVSGRTHKFKWYPIRMAVPSLAQIKGLKIQNRAQIEVGTGFSLPGPHSQRHTLASPVRTLFRHRAYICGQGSEGESAGFKTKPEQVPRAWVACLLPTCPKLLVAATGNGAQ